MLHLCDLITIGSILKVNSVTGEAIELFWPPATVMACVVFIWDYILTFEMEVDHVWKSQWNFMKGLYLFQRYLPFIDIMLIFFIRVSDLVSYFLYAEFFYRSNGGNSDGDRVSEGGVR